MDIIREPLWAHWYIEYGSKGLVMIGILAALAELDFDFMRPVSNILRANCHDHLCSITADDPTMMGGESTYYEFRIYTECPDGVEHQCRQTTSKIRISV